MTTPESPRTLDRLWAGWRSAYVADDSQRVPTGEGSVFTRILAAVDAGELTDETAYVVHRGEHSFVLLNAYPYGTGHTLVLPYREVGALSELTEDESADLWDTVRATAAAVEAAYAPGGMNIGFNLGLAAGAGIPGHLHAHVLPRWDGDTNFVATLAETRVLPEALPDTWRKLVDAWPSA